MSRADPRECIAENPFYVLGLPVTCSRIEVEREGQKLLGMLEIGLSAAGSYRSPLGVHPRTPELIRAAMAELRDPQRRLNHELWAALPSPAPAAAAAEAPAAAPADAAPWPEALAALGWRRP
jgi:hypothetical protein